MVAAALTGGGAAGGAQAQQGGAASAGGGGSSSSSEGGVEKDHQAAVGPVVTVDKFGHLVQVRHGRGTQAAACFWQI